MKSEYEKMIGGEPHRIDDEELKQMRINCEQYLWEFNKLPVGTTINQKKVILEKILGQPIEGSFFIRAPFYCDYGINIKLGKNVSINFDCTMLDSGKIEIGNNVRIGPKVQIYTVFHPTDPIFRTTPTSIAKTIRIEDNVWIGGGAILLPGITIGANSIIGAGSVVTESIPANVIVAGNPARIIRNLDTSKYGQNMFL